MTAVCVPCSLGSGWQMRALPMESVAVFSSEGRVGERTLNPDPSTLSPKF